MINYNDHVSIIILFYYFISTVASFVPDHFVPERVLRENANMAFVLFCPFRDVGNPRPVCTWSRTDSNNITHQLKIQNGGRIIPISFEDNCIIRFTFRDSDNGLYHCTGHNMVGNTTYTFPERFVVESELIAIVQQNYVIPYGWFSVHYHPFYFCCSVLL